MERYLLVGQMSGVSEELLYAGSVPAQRVVWYHERVLVPRERQHPAKKKRSYPSQPGKYNQQNLK